ncbi:MAG: hypothetical protein M1574_01550, partial [Gammaproteobacteria bacterium]|nr:hypothetical protein [Gammaproteobacteria bacterium]
LTLAHIDARLRALGGHPRMRAHARALGRTLLGIEGHLFDVYLTGAREDAFQHPVRILGRLCVLLRVVEHSSDYAPTSQDVAVYRDLDGELAAARNRLREVVQTEVAAFNRRLSQHGLSGLVVIRRT